MAYFYPQINPALQNWYGQFYQPVQPPLQNPGPQTMPQQMFPAQMSGTNQPQQSQAASVASAPVQGGFVRVQSEQEARAYPVAPGNSITFIDESRPYCYTKSVDMSQLDRPKFDRYRLVKEEDQAPDKQDAPVGPQNGLQALEGSGAGNNPAYALKSDLGPLWAEIGALRRLVESATQKAPKKEEVKDDVKSAD